MTWNQLLFQDTTSSIMLQLMSFHDHTLIILTLMMVMAYVMLLLMVNMYSHLTKGLFHHFTYPHQ